MSAPSEISPLEAAKRKAAYAAVDEFVNDKMLIGIGSGSTVVYAVERLMQRVKEEKLSVVCVPTSFQSTNLIIDGGLVLSDLNRCLLVYPSLDVTIDGADEVDEHLNLIKGGGGCQTQEKLIAANSKKLVIIADSRKDSKTLGEQWKGGVPLEVLQLGYVSVMSRISKLGGKPRLRMGGGAKAGPAITDNGHFIVDADFGLIKNPAELHTQLKLIPGVVETGLFCGMACKAFFGLPDGSLKTRDAPAASPVPTLSGLASASTASASASASTSTSAGAGAAASAGTGSAPNSAPSTPRKD